MEYWGLSIADHSYQFVTLPSLPFFIVPSRILSPSSSTSPFPVPVPEAEPSSPEKRQRLDCRRQRAESEDWSYPFCEPDRSEEGRGQERS